MSPKRKRRILPEPPVKRFYVGSSDIANRRSDWAKATIEEAIKQAADKCEESGEPQIVVKIVAIIEPEKQPVKVTRFRG